MTLAAEGSQEKFIISTLTKVMARLLAPNTDKISIETERLETRLTPLTLTLAPNGVNVPDFWPSWPSKNLKTNLSA
jgi:hypothetical protein